MFRQILIVIGVLAASVVPSFANIAFTVPPNAPVVTNWGPNDPVNLGMVFGPLTNVWVTGLGAYYQGAGSYTPSSSEVVDLFQNSNEQLLAQTTVVFTGAAAGYQFSPIAPVALAAGQEYTVSVNVGQNSWAWMPAPLTDPDINFITPSYVYTADPTIFPTGFYPVGGYYGPNVEFESATAPEPGLYGLLAVCLACLLAIVRRRKVV